MIPECFYSYGPDVKQQFLNGGLIACQNIKWDPNASETSLTKEDKASAALVIEDLFDVGEAWKTLCKTS